jgi:hypothetical protein
MSKTVVIQIGNTNNKLTQTEWSHFYNFCSQLVAEYGIVHFSGTSLPNAKWQNACFVIESESLNDLKYQLGITAKNFNQNSIALTIGDTEFVESRNRY